MLDHNEIGKVLDSLVSRICVTEGRVNDFYLGAHLALNVLVNHMGVQDHYEYMNRLDNIIAKEKARWQASTN